MLQTFGNISRIAAVKIEVDIRVSFSQVGCCTQDTFKWVPSDCNFSLNGFGIC